MYIVKKQHKTNKQKVEKTRRADKANFQQDYKVKTIHQIKE